MTPEKLERLLSSVEAIERSLERIALALDERSLERIALALERFEISEQPAPNYQENLKDFLSFNWDSIGAQVEQVDRHGPAVVSWRGHRYIRRSPENTYRAAIYFSRAIGKEESGKTKYERLITFKPPAEVQPISRKAENLI